MILNTASWNKLQNELQARGLDVANGAFEFSAKSYNTLYVESCCVYTYRDEYVYSDGEYILTADELRQAIFDEVVNRIHLYVLSRLA